MTLLVVDRQTCTQCGICAAECPRGVIYFRQKNYPRLLSGKDEYCARCGHCIVVCPSGSLTHLEIPLEQCPPVDRSLRISLAQCAQLIKGRRSIRLYKDRKVSRREIEKIIEVARYAPTAHNGQEVQWLVINDKEEIQRLSGMGTEWMRWVIDNSPQLAPMLEGAIQRQESGIDVFLRHAPAVVIAFAENKNLMAATDCVIALSYFDLAANNAGLGCCWAGYFNAAAASFPPMMAALSLPEGCTPHGSLMVGYPKYKYQRLPLRRPASIIWRP